MEYTPLLSYVKSFVQRDIHAMSVMTGKQPWYCSGIIIETALRDARIRRKLGLDADDGEAPETPTETQA